MRNYQKAALAFVLSVPKCGVWMTPGLGKTVVTLAAINHLIYETLEVASGSVLIIGPKRVVEEVWKQEALLWPELEHLRLSVATGPQQARLDALRRPADIYLINRENLPWLVRLRFKRWPYRLIVYDESGDLKNQNTVRFRALRAVSPLTEQMIQLTGTPATNTLHDLWPQLYLMDQGARLGRTLTAYREAFFVPDKRKKLQVFSWKPKSAAAEKQIHERVSDICMSLHGKDWLKLPKKIDRMVELTLPPAAMSAYRRLVRDKVLPLLGGGVVMAKNAAVLTGKLVQAANGAIYTEAKDAVDIHDVKLEALQEIVDEANGEPLMVFYHFHHDRDRLMKKFPLAEVAGDRADWVVRWNRGEISMLLAQPMSAGHGLNLQMGGHLVVWFSLPWSLDTYIQATARLDRQGQTVSVVVHHLIAKGTVDELIIDALGRKQVTLNGLLAAVKAQVKGETKGAG